VCGVAGAFGVPHASVVVSEMLFAVQHRGQESCGIAIRGPRGNIRTFRGMGLVKNVLTSEVLQDHDGDIGIGHVRYPTAGASNLVNAQPHAIDLAEGPHLAFCANGDLVNYTELRQRLEQEGFTFQSDNDGEVTGRLFALHHVVHHEPAVEALRKTISELRGAYAALMILRDQMWVFRDPHGIRPLILGHLTHSGDGPIPSEGTVLASEDCAFGIIGARRIREVAPGEVICLERGQPVSSVLDLGESPRHCVFELIYFSRPDSIAYDERVHEVRQRIGARLAEKDEGSLDRKDLVAIPVPDSSNFVALGYSRRAGIPYEMGLLRNHYVGRTFIKPSQQARDEGVRQKFNPLPDFFPGRRVVLLDDSIVRGTSLRKLVRMVRAAGAAEVHVRIGSPPVIGPCYYGIDTPTEEELVANRLSVDQIRDYLNADSLRYLEVEDFRHILREPGQFCYACFNRDYIYPPERYGQKLNIPTPRC